MDVRVTVPMMMPMMTHHTPTEIETACRQVERIAELRLKDMLP